MVNRVRELRTERVSGEKYCLDASVTTAIILCTLKIPEVLILSNRPSEKGSEFVGAALGGDAHRAIAYDASEYPALRVSLFDSISEGYALLDSDFRIVDINAEALRLDGRQREDLIGKTHWEAFPESEKSTLGQLYHTAMRERRSVSLEHLYQWVDGRRLWYEMRAYPIDEGGLAIFFRDVSERHRSNQLLRESEARFRAAIDATRGVLWTNDAEGRMTGEQPGWAKLTGQSLAEYQGYGWSNAVHPDDAQPTIVAWNAAVSARTPFHFEHRVKRFDGQWRRFDISAIPVLNDQGQIREWVGVHNDITESTEARLQLTRNAVTFEALVRNNPFGVYVVDDEFKLLHVSEGANTVFSNIENPIGRDFAEILHIIWTEPFASDAIEQFKLTLATGKPYVSHSTIQQRADNGAVEAYDWRIERTALPNGKNGIVCYFYNFSERMKLEDDLRRALDHKDLLAREIEHRVQNSLSIVASLLRMQRSSASSVEAKDALEAASMRVLAIGRVHRQLYKGQDVGFLEFGQYLCELSEDVKQTVGRDNLFFDVQTDAIRLPVDTAVPLGIITNELLTNACKYCDATTDVQIHVKLAEKMGTLTLTITNSGTRMPANFSPDDKSGLGLQVIRALVRQIDGTIIYPKADSEPRFEISLPIGGISSVD